MEYCKKNIFLLALLFIAWPGNKIQAQTTEKIYLSGMDKDHTVSWNFYCTQGRESGKWTTIPVPSQWEQQGFGTYNYGLDWENLHNKIGHEKGLYKYTFSVPKAWKGKSVRIVFEGSMTDTKVKVNGKLAGPVHRGAFYTFGYDISDLLKYGQPNLLEVTVSKVSSNNSVNRAERQADYWIFGGIFRPVYLEAKPYQHIKRIAINATADGSFSARVYTEGKGESASLFGQIQTLGGKKVGDSFKNPVNSQASYQRLSTKVNSIKKWSPEFPNLYNIVFLLKDSHGHVIHKEKERFGFRTVKLKKQDGFYVNGKKIRFRGVNYHSFWPSSGRTISKELVIKDLNLMKDMNMNAVRLSHYPRASYFYDVADSLGLFVLDELAGWHNSYDTTLGHKRVKEMATRNVNHPSIVIWDNGNEGNYNFELDSDFTKWDPQHRLVIHPSGIFNGVSTQNYPVYTCCTKRMFNGNNVFFPTEFLHSLYDGGGGTGLHDYWNLMRDNPLSVGGFIWAFSDECVERTDHNGRLDCASGKAPDGIVGPYRGKEGSFYAIRQVWAPVQIKQNSISSNWGEKLPVENRFFYTNLDQVKFKWKLIDYAGPFDKTEDKKIIDDGIVFSPDIKPQSNGFLTLNLPAKWQKAEALEIKATDPHSRDIYRWTWPINKQHSLAQNIVSDTSKESYSIQRMSNNYILSSESLIVSISKKSGYVEKIQSNGKSYSLSGGPSLVGDSSSLEAIKQEDKTVKVLFTNNDYDSYSNKVSYSIVGNWLKVGFRFLPPKDGSRSYYGIGFNYPEHKVKGIKWLGWGPGRVWKNRQEGMEFGLWSKQKKENSNKVSLDGYHWDLPKFNGYYADLNWAVLNTEEGPITMLIDNPGIYLGLFKPHFPTNAGNAKAAYPEHADISFLRAISPMGSKHKPKELGPSGQQNWFQVPNISRYNKNNYLFKNTLWFYFGDRL